MRRNVIVAGVLGVVLLAGVQDGHAAKWMKQKFDPPNKNLAANYLDGSSVKTHGTTISWTEKFVLTDFGSKYYSRHLEHYPVCRAKIKKLGDVAYHEIDFEIRNGKFRMVAKRNYAKDNKLVCTDRNMGKELNKKWHEIVYGSPMYERHYNIHMKFKVGDL